MTRIFILFILILSTQKLNSQTVDPLISEDFLDQEKWVDSIYNNLTLDEKLDNYFLFRQHRRIKIILKKFLIILKILRLVV